MINRKWAEERELSFRKRHSPWSTSQSVASTTVTVSSDYKSSCADLAGLVEPEPLTLPVGALSDRLSLDVNPDPTVGGGHRHGKFISRTLSREYSLDADGSEGNSEMVELFTRLLIDADAVGTKRGSHVKVLKLTTSKTCPYKTLLRRLPVD